MTKKLLIVICSFLILFEYPLQAFSQDNSSIQTLINSINSAKVQKDNLPEISANFQYDPKSLYIIYDQVNDISSIVACYLKSKNLINSKNIVLTTIGTSPASIAKSNETELISIAVKQYKYYLKELEIAVSDSDKKVKGLTYSKQQKALPLVIPAIAAFIGLAGAINNLGNSLKPSYEINSYNSVIDMDVFYSDIANRLKSDPECNLCIIYPELFIKSGSPILDSINTLKGNLYKLRNLGAEKEYIKNLEELVKSCETQVSALTRLELISQIFDNPNNVVITARPIFAGYTTGLKKSKIFFISDKIYRHTAASLLVTYYYYDNNCNLIIDKQNYKQLKSYGPVKIKDDLKWNP